MPRLRRPLLIALLAAALLLPASAQAVTWVSYPQLRAQVGSGRLQRAVINHALLHIEIKFASGREWEASYPSRDQRMLQRTLHARHIPIIFAARPHTHAAGPRVHHRLRYITAAVLAVALAIATALFLLDARRRRRNQAGAGAASP
jgi:hypothetical protein